MLSTMTEKSIKILLKDAITRSPSDTNYLVQTFKKFVFFNEILKLKQKDDRLLYECIQHGTLKYYPKGSFILHTNQDIDGFYLVFKGIIKCYKLKSLTERKQERILKRILPAYNLPFLNIEKIRNSENIRRKSQFKNIISYIMKNDIVNENINDSSISKVHTSLEDKDNLENNIKKQFNTDTEPISSISEDSQKELEFFSTQSSYESKYFYNGELIYKYVQAFNIGNAIIDSRIQANEAQSPLIAWEDSYIFHLSFYHFNLIFQEYLEEKVEKVNFLNRYYTTLEKNIINDIASSLDIRHYHEFDRVYSTGDHANRLYFIKHGQIILKNESPNTLKSKIEDSSTFEYFSPKDKNSKYRSFTLTNIKKKISKKIAYNYQKEISQLEDSQKAKKTIIAPLNAIVRSGISPKKMLDTINLENMIVTIDEGDFFGEEELLGLHYRIFDAIASTKQTSLYILHLQDKEDLRKILIDIFDEKLKKRKEWYTDERINHAQNKANHYRFQRQNHPLSNLNNTGYINDSGSFIYQNPSIESCIKFLRCNDEEDKVSNDKIKINLMLEGGSIKNNNLNMSNMSKREIVSINLDLENTQFSELPTRLSSRDQKLMKEQFIPEMNESRINLENKYESSTVNSKIFDQKFIKNQIDPLNILKTPPYSNFRIKLAAERTNHKIFKEKTDNNFEGNSFVDTLNNRSNSQMQSFFLPKYLSNFNKNQNEYLENGKKNLRISLDSQNTIISPQNKTEPIMPIKKKNFKFKVENKEEDDSHINTQYSTESRKFSVKYPCESSPESSERNITSSHPKNHSIKSPNIFKFEFKDPFESIWSRFKIIKTPNTKRMIEMKGRTKDILDNSKQNIIIFGSKPFFFNPNSKNKSSKPE